MLRILLASLLLLFLISPLRPKTRPRRPRRPARRKVASSSFALTITNEGKLDDLHKRFRDHTCALLRSTAPS